MNKLRKFKQNEKGQALIEFALVLPVLLLFILGIIEFGWLLNGKITTTYSAREGARAYSLSQDEAEATSIVISNTNLTGLRVDDVVFSVETLANSKEISVITVKAKMTPIIGFFVKSDVDIESKAKMVLE